MKELRGDRRGEAIDIYHHIDDEELRNAYLAFIPKLGYNFDPHTDGVRLSITHA